MIVRFRRNHRGRLEPSAISSFAVRCRPAYHFGEGSTGRRKNTAAKDCRRSRISSMNLRAFSFGVAALLPLTTVAIGCQKSDASTATAPTAKQPVSFNPDTVKIAPPTPGQRFTPTNSALVAFDTETGSLCMTYQWAQSYDGRGMTTCDRLVERPASK